ncbi:MAG: hypothetical protein EXQ95_14895 [Alphaproteobacteria bacterium]|nr:hypothetical protein [Alphaproteobacteria bacterium]
MDGRTLGVSRDRADFVRRGERCWIDGDLIRLSAWPIGGIRPGGRSGPIPRLMDLAALEEAMREVYGGSFRLGDRAPLLQAAANALASGDRRRAAEIADIVSFPPPEYASRLHNAGARYLNWGPAHRRGNPPIDVEAWLDRLDWERKFDPDQPRVPRGHPDGGQWTADPAKTSTFDPDRRITEAEWATTRAVVERVYEEVARAFDRDRNLLHLVGDFRPATGDPLLPPDPWNIPDELAEPEAPRVTIPPGYPTPKVPIAPRLPDGRPETDWQRAKWAISRIRRIVPFVRAAGLWGWAFDLVGLLLPEVATYFDDPQTYEDLRVDSEYVSLGSPEAFAKRYGVEPGYQLHHIVEQGGNDEGWDLHSTKNVIRIPTVRHVVISAHYSSKPKDLARSIHHAKG